MDRTLKTNGLKVKSYGDLVAIATLLALFVGVLAWGLKLESELNTLRDTANARIIALEARVADGILPRAEERIDNHEEEIDRIERRIDRLETRIN